MEITSLSFFNIPPLWQACLASAFRTALACTIVGCITLYGPQSIQTLVAFPAFSYVTAIIIIINDATLGHAFRCCWLALYATLHSLGPAMLTFWAYGPARFSKGTISLAVALAAFVVVVPSKTDLVAKRISLGQIVLVYVIGYANGAHTDPVMQPLRLAASTALGVVACVLALLLPYPRLATYQVNQNYKLLAKNMLKRLKLMVRAICEEDMTCALVLISRAKSMVPARTKLLHAITRHQDSIKWETPINYVLRQHSLSPGEKRLQEIDTNIRGMELALSCTNSFSSSVNIILDEDLKHGLNSLEEHVSLTIKHAKHNLQGGASLTVPESSAKSITHFLQLSLNTNIPITHQDLPFYFFLFCAKLLHNNIIKSLPQPVNDKNGNCPKSETKWAFDWAKTFKSPNLVPAIKFSISLGLAVFMGLIYSKENGFWSGLPVAVSYVSGREATFRVANVKAQGTVLGTVYGVLGCFVFERFLPIRFLSLLPWFVFTGFLQRSRMYGPAGGISAVIGAILILGRRNFGPPSEFAIARIIETFIGLSCSIFVDLMFRPKRASTWAKVLLSRSLATLGESIGSLNLLVVVDSENDLLEENQRRLKMQVNGLRKFVEEAEVEPNFWFLPFHGACYNKLLGSLSRLVDLLYFGGHALKFLQQEFQGNEARLKDMNMLQGEIGHMKELICNSIQCLEEISRMKPLKLLEKEIVKNNNNISSDLELGKATKCNTWMLSSLGDDGIEKTIDSFLQRSKSVVDQLYGGGGGESENNHEMKGQVVMSLSALGFCLKAFMRETLEIEEAIKELVRWENPNNEVNLYEVSCKLHALNK